MMTGLAVLLVVHGLIHLLGFAKAFGLADLDALRQPISPASGVVWLCAAVLFIATAYALFAWPRVWWMIGAAALVVSVVAILPSWSDAKFGLVPNLIVAVAVLAASIGRSVPAGLTSG